MVHCSIICTFKILAISPSTIFNSYLFFTSLFFKPSLVFYLYTNVFSTFCTFYLALDMWLVISQASQALADPLDYPNMFDDLSLALKVIINIFAYFSLNQTPIGAVIL